jgi:trehalose synthase
MARTIEIGRCPGLQDYAGVAHLARAVEELKAEAERLTPRLQGRTVWMVSSTARGGGVAEMLPTLVSLLRELGVAVQWVVMEAEQPEFFPLTKRLHNLIHGEGDPEIGSDARALYDEVSRENAANLRPLLRPEDILVVHDPQPLGTGALLKEDLGLPAIWRCHIGLDEQTPATRAAWSFLEPYATAYDHSVFTAPEYIPPYLAGRATIIHPGVDPLSHKNRDLSLQKLVGVLVDSALLTPYGPVLAPPFPEPARRLQTDGSFAPATKPEDIGLLFRPIITQVSRWDRLKGFRPLLDGFAELKRGGRSEPPDADARYRRSVEIVRLVLAGPDPGSIQDDPEAGEVLDELRAAYLELEPELQRDVVLLALPMASRKHNALMVNALQRSSTIVVQNSLREGFGLTATEAMWKGIAVLGTHACGLRLQIRDGLDGRLVSNPGDPEELADVLSEILADPIARDKNAQTAQRRVHDDFLIFVQLRRWLSVLAERAGGSS